MFASVVVDLVQVLVPSRPQACKEIHRKSPTHIYFANSRTHIHSHTSKREEEVKEGWGRGGGEKGGGGVRNR